MQAPPDYKPPKRTTKIFIPDPDNPTMNYIGQIIGPGGTTQQKLEKESKCKIMIRGKGAQNKVSSSLTEPCRAKSITKRKLMKMSLSMSTSSLMMMITCKRVLQW
jgi:polyribonucleotide nucleotidyltransferase